MKKLVKTKLYGAYVIEVLENGLSHYSIRINSKPATGTFESILLAQNKAMDLIDVELASNRFTQ